MTEHLFPLGIATGAAFCNRRAERRRLGEMVRTGRHAWLTAPRRYGKTSLVEQVCLDLKRGRRTKLALATVDLLLTYDQASVQEAVLGAVGRLSRQIVPATKPLLGALGTYFAGLRPELSVSSDLGAGVRFVLTELQADSLAKALLGLDRMAADRGVRVLLVLEEFQQVASLRDHQPIEAAVRHALERSQQVTYVFSGNHRHMLARMFEDAARPLYHLCERFVLERIGELDYRAFLEHAASLRWESELSGGAFTDLMAVTERHPYYVNRLCARLWRSDRPPSAEDVLEQWGEFVHEERHRVSRELLELSPNQRAVLQAIAEEPTDQPRSKAFLERTRLASASAGQAVQVLLERDVLLQEVSGMLQVLDPAVQWYLTPGWPPPTG